MKIWVLLLVLLSSYEAVYSQSDSTKKMKLSFYGDFYYSHDFGVPFNERKPDFIFNHKRLNEPAINLALAKATITLKKIRLNVGLMMGNYVEYNLSAEPDWAKHIYEANLGFKLSKKRELWLDVGIMPSHIGFESAISADCWALTRSIAAENSPYYEAGVKLSYATKRDRFNIAFLVLNGWQKINRPSFIGKPSVGLQIVFKPGSKFMLNYSNFIGSDKPDSLEALRTFHNLYAIFSLGKKVSVTAGFDLGTDKYDELKYGIWFTPVVMIKYAFTNKWSTTIRGEYYSDKKEIIISTPILNEFQMGGFSSNVDYKLGKHITLRAEAKLYQAAKDFFAGNEKTNVTVTTNLLVKF